MLPLRSAILFTLLGSLDSMIHIFASARGPINHRTGKKQKDDDDVSHQGNLFIPMHQTWQQARSYLLPSCLSCTNLKKKGLVIFFLDCDF